MLERIPNVFVIVSLLLVLAAAATWVLPGGAYERRKERVGGSDRTVVVEGTFQSQPAKPQGLAVLAAPLKGFRKLAEIIAFIFVVGGAFAMLEETGAIAAGIRSLVRSLKGARLLIVPLVMLIFSLFGAIFGMCEEAIPFVLIFVPLSLALGYDSLVGVSMTFVAAGVGFAGAFINPFTLQIAQGLAGVEPLSGMGFRIVVWALSTGLAIGWVTLYAWRIGRDPKRSPMYELDQARRIELAAEQAQHQELTLRHGVVLAVLGLTVVGLIAGVTLWGWYIDELGALFLAMGIVTGAVAGLGPNALAAAFIKGCKDMASAALVVGFAGGILVVLEDGGVMDTLLHGMASVLSRTPPLVAAQVQYGVQMALNVFIPSGSTKAALTMPIMAPLADLSGVSRQTAVLAYQLGDGFTNLIIPTSGVTVGTLAMARIPFERWFRWHLPLQLAFFVLSLALLAWAVATGWS